MLEVKSYVLLPPRADRPGARFASPDGVVIMQRYAEVDRHPWFGLIAPDRARMAPYYWGKLEDVPKGPERFDHVIDTGSENMTNYGIWNDGDLAGNLSIKHNLTNRNVASIGFFLGKPYEGRGLAHRAVRAGVGYVFGEMGLSAVQAHAHKNNPDSVMVLHSTGFQSIEWNKPHVLFEIKR